MGSTSDDWLSASNSSGVPPASLLYLLPSDFSGTIVVTKAFNGSGYGSWRRGMLLGLSYKNKLEMINGSILKPRSTSSLLEPWIRCNDMLVAWILNSLATKIR